MCIYLFSIIYLNVSIPPINLQTPTACVLICSAIFYYLFYSVSDSFDGMNEKTENRNHTTLTWK